MTTNEILLKVANNYSCEKCDYMCSNKTNFNKHLFTRKHINANNTNAKLLKVASTYDCCNCGNVYKHCSSLCKHKKTCIKENITISFNECSLNDDNTILSNLVKELVQGNQELAKQNHDVLLQNQELAKQSQELQKHVIELCKNGTHNTNSNNKSFNINVFLNEQCKDAINLSDFIKSIEVSREDLENNLQVGFVAGISKIFLDNLRQLGVNERPIHCTDLKREIMYIKNEDKWTKETDDAKLNSAILNVSSKGLGTLTKWKQENPDYKDVNSAFYDKCDQINLTSLAGHNRDVYYPKVIHALARETMIDK